MDHSNMEHHMPESMAEMPMVFFNSINTPLYTIAWKPTTTLQYAFTCLFLVLLCIVFRTLLATRCNLPQLLAYRRTRKVANEQVSCCTEEDIDLVEKQLHRAVDLDNSEGGDGSRQSKAGEVLLRALLDTLLALVSYLL